MPDDETDEQFERYVRSVLFQWDCGRDTFDIASYLRLRQSAIERMLHYGIEQRRAERFAIVGKKE